MDKIIKFRAWHFLRKQMYDVADITFRNNFIGANALDVQKNTIDCTIGINYIDGNEKSFELMQYSGHKDKSGIEIYSGDILCYLDGFHNEIIQAVVFQNDSGAFVLEDGRPEPFNTTVNAIHDTCRVIGNIYENENLIHKKICTE